MKQTLKQKIGSIPLIDYIHNVFVLMCAKIQIAENPSFVSKEAVEKYFELLQNSSFYVEFGSGGSTVAAAKLGKNFSSYEPSEKFLKLVSNKSYSWKDFPSITSNESRIIVLQVK